MRNRFLCFFLGLLFLTATAAAEPSFYQCDQEHSRVGFTLRHLGVLTVSGQFKRFDGSFRFDPENIAASDVEILIHSGSIESGNRLRDTDLRSAHFFSSEKHPVIRFKSGRIENIEEQKFEIHGQLTIKGITRPVIFYTELLEGTETGRLHFRTWAVIKRKDFNLGKKSFFQPILFITNEELRIELDVQGVPAKVDFVAI